LVAILWTDEAIEGLEEVYAWIASDKPGAAGRVAEQLIAAADSLADFPQRGREIAPGLRQLTHLSPYLLRYSYDPFAGIVTIQTIWHGTRHLG
jgi:toxin ParE1/3/4